MFQSLLRVALFPYLLMVIVVGMVAYRVSPAFKRQVDLFHDNCGLFHTDCDWSCTPCYEDTKRRVALYHSKGMDAGWSEEWLERCRQQREAEGLPV